MTRHNLYLQLKVLTFTIFFFLVCGFQTSFWPHVISFVPGPQIWLLIIFFIILKWPPVLGVFYIYFLGFCLTQFSHIPLKMIWCSSIVTYLFLSILKSRIQLTGVFSFMLYSLVGSFFFQINYVWLSMLIEKVPTSWLILDRFTQILINFIASYFLYFILNRMNKLFSKPTDWTQTPSAQKHEYES